MKFYRFSEHGYEGSDTLFGIVISRDHLGKIDIQFVIFGKCLGITV